MGGYTIEEVVEDLYCNSCTRLGRDARKRIQKIPTYRKAKKKVQPERAALLLFLVGKARRLCDRNIFRYDVLVWREKFRYVLTFATILE